MVQESPEAVQVAPLGEATAVYPVMVEPPAAGAVHEAVMELLVTVGVPRVGAPGTVAGMDEALVPDDVPTALVAVTVKV